MQRLYEARARGLTTAESVRRAGLDVLGWQRHQGRTARPFFWGAFVATGDRRLSLFEHIRISLSMVHAKRSIEKRRLDAIHSDVGSDPS